MIAGSESSLIRLILKKLTVTIFNDYEEEFWEDLIPYEIERHTFGA